MSKIIKTTKGHEFIVDDEDFEFLSQYTWLSYKEKRSKNKFIASTSSSSKIGAKRMARLIMNCPKDLTVDHINGDTIDNRKQNLRICTSAENNRNKSKKSGKFSSKYVGVSWSKINNKWYASIKHNGKSYNLGYFLNEIDAAKAYNNKASEFYGKFAKFNEV